MVPIRYTKDQYKANRKTVKKSLAYWLFSHVKLESRIHHSKARGPRLYFIGLSSITTGNNRPVLVLLEKGRRQREMLQHLKPQTTLK